MMHLPNYTPEANNIMNRYFAARTLLHDAGLLHDKKTGYVIGSRLITLEAFVNDHCETKQQALDTITIETNRSCHYCPKPKSAKQYQRIGGTAGKQHHWAVIR